MPKAKQQDQVSFDVTSDEQFLIERIAKRMQPLYHRLNIDDDKTTMLMDITACHANGCPLDLRKLLEADDFTFGHDVLGIRRHINRQTGQIENCFLPRCSKH